jgi:hypothetical protein
MRPAGDRMDVRLNSFCAGPDLRRRVLLMLVGGFRILHPVIETVW